MATAAQLVITMDDVGGIGISGPIEQKGLCYMMLMLAHDVIKDHCDQVAKGRNGLVIAGPGSVPEPSNGKNRLPNG